MTEGKPREPQKNAIFERVQARLEKLGISETRAAREAGLGDDAIRDMRRKTKNMPRVDTLTALAKSLQTTPQWLAYGAGSEDELGDAEMMAGSGLPVRGEVAAGLWLELDYLDDQPVRDLPIAFDPRYPRSAQYALRVRGTSVNRVARPDDYVLCVDIAETGIEPGNGALVVVERRRGQGGTKEVTAKRIRRAGAIVRLMPDSDDPKWQEALVLDPRRAGEDEEIVIVAIVTGVYREVSTR